MFMAYIQLSRPEMAKRFGSRAKKIENTYTLPVKGLDTPSRSRVFYFSIFYIVEY